MRILVTGHLGYIGSVLAGVLQHARFDVVGLDCDFYRDCDFGRMHRTFPSFDTDIRDIEFTDLLSFDAVVHLADVPEGADAGIAPAVARELSEETTLRLAQCCKKAGVARFLYASSWAVYGRAGGHTLDERSPLDPLTPHSASKVRCEGALARMANESFSPVILRHASVFGVSPRLRLDTPVNDLVASAVVNGRARLATDGRDFKPLVHVEDLARVYAALLTAPDENVYDKVFNVVAPGENRRAIDIADAVTELVPDCTRAVNGYDFNEPSCCLNGERLAKTLPDFAFRWNLATGIRQLRNAIAGACMTPGDWRSDRYRRALRLRSLVERETLTDSLRTCGAQAVEV